MYDEICLFVQLIDAGGFSHVALKLNTYQSTISKKIMRLEQALNMILINRNTRNLQLTEQGLYLYSRFKDTFSDFDLTLNDVKSSNNLKNSGKLSISISPSISTKEINGLILDFTNLYPDVILDIHYTIQEINLLKDNVDLAITLAKPSQETAVIKTIWQLNTILCASPEYIRTYGEPVDVEDLEQHKIILPLISMRNNSIVEGIHTATNRVITQKFDRRSIAVNSSASNVNFALTGKCIVPIYDIVAQEYLDNGRLVRILPEYQALPLSVYLARPTVYKNKLVDLFSDYVVASLRKIDDERITKFSQAIKTTISA